MEEAHLIVNLKSLLPFQESKVIGGQPAMHLMLTTSSSPASWTKAVSYASCLFLIYKVFMERVVTQNL